MRAYIHILHKLGRILAGLPFETAAAALLVALTHPGVLSFVLLTVASRILTWWLAAMFAIHIWPELPPEHQRALLALRDQAVLKEPDQDLPARRGALGSRGSGVKPRHKPRHP